MFRAPVPADSLERNRACSRRPPERSSFAVPLLLLPDLITQLFVQAIELLIRLAALGYLPSKGREQLIRGRFGHRLLDQFRSVFRDIPSRSSRTLCQFLPRLGRKAKLHGHFDRGSSD